jgi:hypothetical protein
MNNVCDIFVGEQRLKTWTIREIVDDVCGCRWDGVQSDRATSVPVEQLHDRMAKKAACARYQRQLIGHANPSNNFSGMEIRDLCIAVPGVAQDLVGVGTQLRQCRIDACRRA